MTPRRKVVICLAANTVLLVVVASLVILCAAENDYFRFGPSDSFIVISVPIDSWVRYHTLLVLISVVKMSRVVIEEIGNPVMDFSIYNPDKTVITEFTRRELFVFANAMYFVSAIRNVFEIMITVTQIDIAMFSVVATSVAGLVSTWVLMREKSFPTEDEMV